jgi:hypothetical protein
MPLVKIGSAPGSSCEDTSFVAEFLNGCDVPRAPIDLAAFVHAIDDLLVAA